MKKLLFLSIAILALVFSCDLNEINKSVDWKSINLTDARVTGKWFDSRTYGNSEYSDYGYNYILTINADGTYSQIAHSYRNIVGNHTYSSDFNSPITIDTIEYTSKNLIGDPSIRINRKYEYIEY